MMEMQKIWKLKFSKLMFNQLPIHAPPHVASQSTSLVPMEHIIYKGSLGVIVPTI
jgi:hypothetical protein